MKTTSLGLSGEQVSAMALGTMLYGTKYDEDRSRALLDQYFEAGGRFLDTANVYAHWVNDDTRGGESELLVGRWLKDRGNRDELFISTKVGFGFPGTDEYPGPDDTLSAKVIEAECEKSLKRLGLDCIDLYFAHWDHRPTPLQEVLTAFDKLVKAGKVRHIGASNYVAWRLAEALMTSDVNGLAKYVCTQQKHTYLRVNHGVDPQKWPPANEEFLEVCKLKNLAIMAYSPVLRGAYSREDRPIPARYQSPDSEARLNALRTMAAARGVSANQLVLAWLRHSDPVVIPLFSASTPEQMQENLGALKIELSAAEMARLNSAGAN